MGEWIKLEIGKGWTPDLTPEEAAQYGGLRVAQNIIPVNNHYNPVCGKSAFNSTVFGGTPLSGMYVQDESGVYHNFLGTSTKLYRFNRTTATDVTKLTTTYSGGSWAFEKYGTWMIATNYTDNVQVLKGITGANFVDLGGSPDKAKYCLLNHGHLILGHLYNYPKKVRWSARDDIEQWTPDLLTGAGSQNFFDMDGNITGIGSIGDNFIITSPHTITLGYYVGGYYTFDFRRSSIRNVGCHYPQSFISIGSEVYFWGKESVYKFDGNNIEDIGKDIRGALFGSLNVDQAHRITATHDKLNRLIVWAYPTSIGGYPDKLLVYNYSENRFTTINLSCYCAFIGMVGSLSIDELTTYDIDGMDISIDSAMWYGENLQPILIDDTDGKSKTLQGATLSAILETGEMVNHPDVLMLKSIRTPIENPVSTSLTVKHRYNISDDYTEETPITLINETEFIGVANKRLSLKLETQGFHKIGNTIDIEIIKKGES